MRRHKARQAEEKLRCGPAYTDNDLVFCREDGKLTDPRTFNVYFNRILKSARLPPIRLHDARHTYATLLLEEGVQAKVVQEILGHGSIAMTLDIYSHVSMDLKREAAAKLNVVFTDKFR